MNDLRKIVCDLPTLLLMLVVLTSGVVTLGFCMGSVLSGWVFWLVFTFELTCVALVSKRAALAFASIVISCLMVTAYTFSYVGTDALGCWFPMQQMIKSGWNPVWDGSREGIAAAIGDANIAVNHVFMYSKFVPLVGAIVSRATGLFAADTFLAYILIVSLWIVSKRLAEKYWNCFGFSAHTFAASVVLTTKIVGAIGGYVDYDVYAAMLLTVFSLALARNNDDDSIVHILLFVLSDIVLFSVKSNGILFALMLLAAFVVCMFPHSRRQAWVVPLCVVGGALLLNINPILPVAREVLFESKEIVNVTPDFTGNVDALKLGYFWRIVYAWVSPCLVPGNPQFFVLGGVGGFGTGFRFALLASVVALFLSKKNFITVLVVMLFVTGNCLPLKYIGHARYCPQMWAIPMIAAFQFAFMPKGIDREWIKKTIRFSCVGVLCVFSTLVSVRTLAFFKKNLAFEYARQMDLAVFRGAEFAMSERAMKDRESYAVVARLMAADLRWGKEADEGVKILSYDSPKYSFVYDGTLLPEGGRMNSLYPPGDNPRIWFDFAFCKRWYLPNPWL